MKRKFVTNLLLLVFLNILIKPFWIFGIDRTVQNVVGAESYGLYFSLLNFSMILNILLDLGLTNFNNRNIARHHQLVGKYLRNIVGLKFLLAGVYAIFCLTAAWLIGYDRVQFHLIIFLIFNQFLISFTLYLRSNISGLHLFRTDSLLSVLDRSLMIIICSVLLFTRITNGVFLIEWFVYAQTAAYVLATLITYLITLYHTGPIRIRFDKRFFLLFLKQSYPYALLVLLMSFYNRIDSVMLERLLPDPQGKEQAGIYAQAFRLLDAAAMFGVLFAGLLLPIFSRMIKNREQVGQMVRLSFVLIIIPAIILAVSSYYYREPLMGLLYRKHVETSAQLFGILMVGFTGIASSYIFGSLLTANGSLRQLNLMAFAGMVINITLNLILIPRFQALGSAWASLATQLFTALAQLLIARHLFRLKTNYPLLTKLFLFVVFTLTAGQLSLFIPHWMAGYLAMISASAVFAFLVGLVTLEGMMRILKREEKHEQPETDT